MAKLEVHPNLCMCEFCMCNPWYRKDKTIHCPDCFCTFCQDMTADAENDLLDQAMERKAERLLEGL